MDLLLLCSSNERLYIIDMHYELSPIEASTHSIFIGMHGVTCDQQSIEDSR